jgi:hypothetical protein
LFPSHTSNFVKQHCKIITKSGTQAALATQCFNFPPEKNTSQTNLLQYLVEEITPKTMPKILK